jgi:folate-binding protein YgfZ
MTDTLTAIAPGFEQVTVFSGIADEYAAIRHGAALIDRSARLRMIFGGVKAGDALTGLVTNDVLALTPSHGQFAGALTAKGKIIADVRIFARADGYLVDASPAAGPGFAAMIRKYVNPRLAQYADVSQVLRTIGVFGPRAAAVLATVCAVPHVALDGLAPYQQLRGTFADSAIDIARVPDLGGAGFDCFVPVEHATAFWEHVLAAGATPVGIDAADIARIESGWPRWGVDMDDNTLAQEANFDELAGISYTKGCYTGQETVARVHFRGHVNRHLRGLVSESVLPAKAELFSDDGASCGEVRSSANSPAFGPIALGLVRREIAEGARVIARVDGIDVPATVVALPFR